MPLPCAGYRSARDVRKAPVELRKTESRMNKLFKHVHPKISAVTLRPMDEAADRRVGERSLAKYVKSVFRGDANGVGMTDSQSAGCIILKQIFSHITLKERDSFLDVGCGKGRVLAYLVKEHAPCRLYGA